MARILHIETATQVCSVALSDSGKLIALRESHEKNIHSSIITVFIDQIMKEADLAFNSLDAIAVSKGPGSYTGLRIGVSTAKGICYGAGKPLIAVGTLQSMASGMASLSTGTPSLQIGTPSLSTGTPSLSTGTPSLPILYCPMIDARRMEVYNCLYDSKIHPTREILAEIITEGSFADLLEKNIIVFAGDGAEKCRPLLGLHPNAVFLEDFFPSAANMIPLAQKKLEDSEFEDVAYFEPFYLKDFIPGIPKVKGLSF
jgi:tRNA threonylcarbamoyladenosine biosynthesis protein TsaB